MANASVRYPALAGIFCFCVALAAASEARQRVPLPTPNEVVLAQGCGLDSTADLDQQRQIRRLAAAGDTDEAGPVTIDYPHDASIFPPEIIAPTFLWHDSQADGWLVDIAFADPACRLQILVPGFPPPEGEIDPLAISGTNEIYRPTPYQASARSWKPRPQVWEAIKRHSIDRPAGVTFLGYRGTDFGRVVSRGRMTLQTSSDPAGAPIFYRDVPLSPATTQEGTIAPLPKGALPLIAWRLRDVSLPESRVLLTDMPTCANCHSFSADGATLGMDIDGPSGDKGAYAITPIEREVVIENDEVITWNAFEGKLPGHRTLGFLSRMSPDGRHVVSTVNESIYVMNFPDFRFGQVFYPTRGILAYYSTETKAMQALPGADDVDYVHTDAVWTPDGKTLVFARAPSKDPYDRDRPQAKYAGDPNETPIQYDLYRIPFNDGRGGQPEPIAGASDNGMSNTFPKVSPDGKWIVFVQCKNGQLMRPDSKLWIIPASGGEPRLMRANTSRMNSWHSFSPNGRWMVFSSKSNTPYTQMFLTHIDEKGNDSPAILIENSTAANRAVNIPEFVNVPFDDFVSITAPAVEHYRHFHRGIDLALAGQDREAIAEFEKALQQESGDSRIHDSMGKTLLKLGLHDRALEHIRKSLEINPYNFEMHTNMAFILSERGADKQALLHMDKAIQLYPRYPLSWYNRATLQLQQRRFERARDDYTEAIRLHSRYPDALTGRGVAFRELGDLGSAREDFGAAIRLNPNDPAPWYMRARIRHETGDQMGAAEDLLRAREVATPDSARFAEIDSLYAQVLAAMNDQDRNRE